jgi:hypothetical protein
MSSLVRTLQNRIMEAKRVRLVRVYLGKVWDREENKYVPNYTHRYPLHGKQPEPEVPAAKRRKKDRVPFMLYRSKKTKAWLKRRAERRAAKEE